MLIQRRLCLLAQSVVDADSGALVLAGFRRLR